MPSMRALHQKKYGDVSTFEMGDLPVPTPGTSEVLLRVHAAGLNPIDLKRSYLCNPDDETFPVVTGYDVAGVVESVGSGVTDFAPGDRVFGDPQEPSGAAKSTGTVAEFCVGKQHLLARMPEGTSFVEAAALPVAACTAVQALEIAGLKEGDKLFISGGAGGVGIHAIQIAKALFGASEVATTASAVKTDFVKMYGADKVVDYKTEDAGKVLAGWADVALDTTSESEMEKRVLKEGGSLVSIAEFGTPGVRAMMLEPGRKLLEQLAKLLKEGKLKAVVDSVYELEEGVKAVQHVAGGRAKGKVVVKVHE
ncbi:unnamed protein product [Chondrus crispus]|uniref:Enoyl reductase (ER) domain-containing protein n=1 Tax=Chondrus crispus TaxID=2769 RepID=R7Q7E5_CHOCR|nr:unnamed protein product [Chondrus crispus]CDF33306.1 unnamed protein product [Chondrus crispus]|eukprot:XP_005713109.1 unnamed protein product [Chondrus crispus]